MKNTICEATICEDAAGLGRAASNWCREKITQYRARSIFIPAGQTPVALYKLWQSENPEYLRGLDLLQIDDVMAGSKKGVFRRFFNEHLPSFQKQISPIEHADRVADLAILGLGLNGHVAFHEPGLAPSFFSGCVPLSETTVKNLQLESGTWGISYGVGAFVQCKAILFMVSGASKRDVLRKFQAADLSLPASSLLRHSDIMLLVDREALGKVGYGATTNTSCEPKENEIS